VRPIGACPSPEAIARALEGEPAAELGEHLDRCARCRARREELRAIAGALAADPVDDLPDLAPLVVRRAALPRRRALPPLAAAASLAAALVGAASGGVVLERHRLAVAGEAGFQARGGHETADSWVALHPYLVRDGERPRPLAGDDELVRCNDRLLFAYDNGGPHPYRYLMVLAADERGAVRWLFPDGAEPGARSIAAEPGAGRELHEELGLAAGCDDVAVRRFDLYAVFSDEPIAAATIGARLAVPGAERLPLPSTGQQRLRLRLEVERDRPEPPVGGARVR